MKSLLNSATKNLVSSTTQELLFVGDKVSYGRDADYEIIDISDETFSIKLINGLTRTYPISPSHLHCKKI
jgi:hypothetical protein